VSEIRDPLEYVLNRMEAAAGQTTPANHGYGPARRELLAGIAALREENEGLRAVSEALALLIKFHDEARAVGLFSRSHVEGPLWGCTISGVRGGSLGYPDAKYATGKTPLEAITNAALTLKLAPERPTLGPGEEGRECE